jgi:hypothetical protein
MIILASMCAVAIVTIYTDYKSLYAFLAKDAWAVIAVGAQYRDVSRERNGCGSVFRHCHDMVFARLGNGRRPRLVLMVVF